MPNLEGQILKGRYRIEELVGRGGMAEVYKAWDTHRQYHVAIKLMREDLAEDGEFLQRFKREARALAALSHANIIRFYSFERERRLAFIVMDYVEGTTLRGQILDAEGAPLPLEQVASIAGQVCAALHYAHTENVLHRDIKPGNIIIQPDGRAMLSDFGIAKAADAATTTTVMPGTPAYMSPEQCRSQPLDTRTDIYSLGVVVYEMLAGRRPFAGELAPETVTGSTRERIRWEQMHAAPLPLRRFNPALPSQVETVVLKALAKERAERWPSALAFWHALEVALGVLTIPDTTEPRVDATLEPEPGMAATTAEVMSPSEPTSLPPAVAKPWTAWRPSSWAWGLAGLGLLAIAVIAFLVLKPASSLLNSHLAFVSDRDGNPEIYVMDGKGEVAQLTQGAGNEADPAWSPDKTHLAFASNRSGNWEIYWMKADGTGLTQVTRNPARDVEPAWSPDGRYIAFTSDRDGKREVYMAGPDGISRITHTPGEAESWEPAWAAGGTILFTSSRAGKREVYHISQSGEVVRVTYTSGSGESWSPAWSWGGNYTAFVSSRRGQREVYTLSPGGALTQISHTPSGQGSWEPSCSSLGEFIAFTSNRDGRQQVYTITQEGIRQLTHPPNPGQSWSPAW